MQARIQVVQNYFNQTNKYLNDNLVIGLRLQLIKKNLPTLENKNIIDIGCGNGEITLPYINNNRITFLDLSNNMLDIVRKQIPDKYFQHAEIINQEFEKFMPEKKYDYLFFLGVLAHVESIDMTFSKLSKLLKSEGVLIIQYTNSLNIFSLFIRMIGELKRAFGKKYGYKINYISSNEVIKALKKNKMAYYKKITYWPSLPGFKLIPYGIRKFIYYKILNSLLLQQFGGEIILFVSLDRK